MFGVLFSPDSRYVLTGNLDGVVGVWVTGKNEVDLVDRSKMIALGFERISDIRLDLDECELLRSMKIPIFEFVYRNWKEMEAGGSCPLPFLGQ